MKFSTNTSVPHQKLDIIRRKEQCEREYYVKKYNLYFTNVVIKRAEQTIVKQQENTVSPEENI